MLEIPYQDHNNVWYMAPNCMAHLVLVHRSGIVGFRVSGFESPGYARRSPAAALLAYRLPLLEAEKAKSEQICAKHLGDHMRALDQGTLMETFGRS